MTLSPTGRGHRLRLGRHAPQSQYVRIEVRCVDGRVGPGTPTTTPPRSILMTYSLARGGQRHRVRGWQFLDDRNPRDRGW